RPRIKERSKMAIETTHMRKFLNEPAQIVKESLAGLAAAHPDLVRYDPAAQIIVRKDAPRKGKVALISGGGSGHEPLHGGFVGLGMLDAACPGEVFTSPVPAPMLAATKAVDGGTGADLTHVTDAVNRLNDRSRSVAAALSSCVPPASGKAIFDLPEGEVELGIGIHGEPGRKRARLGSASEIVDVMVEAVISDLKP